MISGERISHLGHEVCLFPIDWLHCTQVSGPGNPSHCCGTATDWIGPYDYYPYYAPFSCTKIYQDSETVCYKNDAPVWTPSGLQQDVIISFTHDNNPPAANHFTQGDLIGYTGDAGFVMGVHVHLDQAFDSQRVLIDSGITCAYGNRCYYLRNGIVPASCYYLSGHETVVDTLGQTFQIWSGSILTASVLAVVLFQMKKRKEELLHGKRITGSL